MGWQPAAVAASMAMAGLLVAMIFPALPEGAHAEEPATATPRVIGEPTVSLSVPATIEFTDVMATPSGATTTASAKINVTTTASAGYKLYLYAEDNSLKSLNPNTTQSITSASASSLDNFTNNTWGYNLTEGTTAGTTYSALPTTNTTPTQTKDTSTTNSANDTYTLSLGAKVDSTIPSGTYTSTLTISVVAEPALVTIVFNGNGATSGSMDSLRIPAGSSQTLPSNTFTRTNYNFIGWSTAANGSGTSYADAASLTTTAAQAGQTITLYAQWVPIMQNFTLADCQSQASSNNVTVVDSRDNNTYTVRYINGACWMTQNLRLSSTTERGESRVLTSADSNVTRNWSFPNNSLTSGDSFTEARSAINSNTSYGGYYNYCAASAGTVCNDTTKQDATQDICPKGWRLPTYNEQNGIRSYASAFSPVLSGYYSLGTLRSTGSYGYWWSATAFNSRNQYRLAYDGSSLNTIYSGKLLGFSVRCIRSNPGTLTINFNGNGSTGGSTASQQIAAGNTAHLNANGFTRSGYAFTGWNTAADGSGTSYADGADYTVTPATGDATVTLYAQWEELTMQTFTNALCQTLASSANYTVKDARDNNEYTVRYINGACWMTQNLRLAGGTELNSTTSNVSSNYTLPADSTASGTFWDNDGSVHYSGNTDYGSYYDFCAASAGTRCNYNSSDDSENDICPKGWRLPTYNEQKGIRSYSSAFSPVLSGYYSGGTLYSTGSLGYWWSATASDSSYQYFLGYNGSSLNTGNIDKSYGISVRCIRSS